MSEETQQKPPDIREIMTDYSNAVKILSSAAFLGLVSAFFVKRNEKLVV